jgi:hypothetical protein
MAKRPSRSKPVDSRSAYEAIAKMTITVTVGARPKKLPPEQVLLLKTYEEALSGKVGACRVILRMVVERERARGRLGGGSTLPIFLFEHKSSTSIDAALLLLGIARQKADEPPGYLQLEPWAVDQAFNRTFDGRLSAKDLRDLREHVADSDELLWPEAYSND